jgi:hypothetical protein
VEWSGGKNKKWIKFGKFRGKIQEKMKEKKCIKDVQLEICWVRKIFFPSPLPPPPLAPTIPGKILKLMLNILWELAAPK